MFIRKFKKSAVSNKGPVRPDYSNVLSSTPQVELKTLPPQNSDIPPRAATITRTDSKRRESSQRLPRQSTVSKPPSPQPLKPLPPPTPPSADRAAVAASSATRPATLDGGDSPISTGLTVIKRERKFSSSLRFRRSGSVSVSQHPIPQSRDDMSLTRDAARDNTLSITRDDNDVTRCIARAYPSNELQKNVSKSPPKVIVTKESYTKCYSTGTSRPVNRNIDANLQKQLFVNSDNFNTQPSTTNGKIARANSGAAHKSSRDSFKSRDRVKSPVMTCSVRLQPSEGKVAGIRKQNESDVPMSTPVRLNEKSGGIRSAERGEVRKWGSCSTLEYNNNTQQPSTYGQFSERTEGDGGPASVISSSSYPDNYGGVTSQTPYRRHSGASSDDVILAQKAEIDEKNRLIESLKLRVSEVDGTRQAERAYSDKSGEHGAIAESLDSGIDIRSDSGIIKPPYHRSTEPGGYRTVADDRGEVARLRLYVKQLEARLDGVAVGGGDAAIQRIESLQQDKDKLIEEKNSINRKFARLQDYLTTLPTVNEFKELKEKLAQVTDENKSLQEEQKRSGETTKDSKQKDLELKKYQKKCIDLRESVQKLEKQNAVLKSQNAVQSRQELQKVESEKTKMEKQIETLKKEISVLSEQKESSKNLVGGYYEKYSNELEVNKELTRLVEERGREVEEMKLKLEDHVDQVETLQRKISDLEGDNTTLTTQLRDYTDKEECQVGDNQLLMTELHLAFRDLQSIVEVCQMRATGQQLDLSLLLGLGNSPGPLSSSDLTIEDQLKHIQSVRTNIEYLRNQISEIYAEEVGSKCPTQ